MKVASQQYGFSIDRLGRRYGELFLANIVLSVGYTACFTAGAFLGWVPLGKLFYLPVVIYLAGITLFLISVQRRDRNLLEMSVLVAVGIPTTAFFMVSAWSIALQVPLVLSSLVG